MAICYSSSRKLIETISSCVRLGNLFNLSMPASSSTKWDDNNSYFMGQLWRLDKESHVENVEPCMLHSKCSINFIVPAILIPHSSLIFSGSNSVLGLLHMVVSFIFLKRSQRAGLSSIFPTLQMQNGSERWYGFPGTHSSLVRELDLEFRMLWLQTWTSFC